MSGLLHRLAAEATGRTGPRLHSMARIPFVAPPSLNDADQTRRPEPGLDTTPAAPGVPWTSDPSPLAEPPLLLPAPRLDAAVDHPPAPGNETRFQLEQELRPVAQPRPALGQPATPQAPPPASASRTGPGPEQGPTPRTERARPPEAPRRSLSDPLLDASRSRHDGLRPGTRVAVRPIRAAQSVQDSPARESETTEVHVHIGRIEVTAVQEAQPATPKRPAARGPMSLEEYLNRRREERR